MNVKSISRWSASESVGGAQRLGDLGAVRWQRGMLAAGLIAVIAMLDAWGEQYVRNNYSILYVIPLILLAHAGVSRQLWRWAWLLIALTYGMHFLKNFLSPPPVGDAVYFDFRLINRTFTALMILALAKMLQLWIEGRDRRTDEDELGHEQDEEVASTLAAICFAPMIIVIALVDFLVPAHINMAILYPIPLFVAGWTRNRGLLWGTVVALLLLTVLAFSGGPAAGVPDFFFGLERQRLLAAIAMLAVAIHLHIWLAPERAGK
jgi:hypothetical protein